MSRNEDDPGELAELKLPPGVEQFGNHRASRPRPGESDPRTLRGTDPTGSLMVQVDPSGRVVDVRVAGYWRSEIAPDEFGTAVLTAYWAAVEAALTAARQSPGNPEEPAATTGFGADLPTTWTDEALQDWSARTMATMRELDQQLDEFAEMSAKQPAPPPDREFTSPQGHITVRTSQGAIVDIHCDPAIARLTDTQLTGEACAVLRAAVPARDSAGEGDESVRH